MEGLWETKVPLLARNPEREQDGAEPLRGRGTTSVHCVGNSTCGFLVRTKCPPKHTTLAPIPSRGALMGDRGEIFLKNLH